MAKVTSISSRLEKLNREKISYWLREYANDIEEGKINTVAVGFCDESGEWVWAIHGSVHKLCLEVMRTKFMRFWQLLSDTNENCRSEY